MKPGFDDDGCGLTLVTFVVMPVLLVAMLIPIAFIASFLVPVDLPIAVFAVLTGVVIVVRVADRSLFAVCVGGAVWIIGVFVLSTVLGPGPLFFGTAFVASTILWWVLGAESRRDAEAEAAANRERTRRAAFRWSTVSSQGRSVLFDCWEVDGRTYAWDFGDSSGADVASPTHRYAEPGSYEVTLTVTGPQGSDTVTKTVSVG